jgi:hypothetical protein
MQRLLQLLPALTRTSTAREQTRPRLRAARMANKYGAEEVLTAQ